MKWLDPNFPSSQATIMSVYSHPSQEIMEVYSLNLGIQKVLGSRIQLPSVNGMVTTLQTCIHGILNAKTSKLFLTRFLDCWLPDCYSRQEIRKTLSENPDQSKRNDVNIQGFLPKLFIYIYLQLSSNSTSFLYISRTSNELFKNVFYS